MVQAVLLLKCSGIRLRASFLCGNPKRHSNFGAGVCSFETYTETDSQVQAAGCLSEIMVPTNRQLNFRIRMKISFLGRSGPDCL
jgi:hypothetical protein